MNQRHVEFLIIGGFAVNFHGFPRLTHDIDFLVDSDKENLEQLRGVLVDFGFEGSALPSPLFTPEKPILRFGIPPNRVELFHEIPGVLWEECWINRIHSNVDNLQLHWIGLRELRKNKRACNRAKDQIDLKELPEV